MKEKILVASNNKGKIKEIKEILESDFEILSLNDVNCEVEVEETETTAEGNSYKKASEISKIVGLPCIADDSGLYIDALDGFPGIYTARFLGENATQEERNNYLIEKLSDKTNRKAKIITAMTYVNGKDIVVARGELEGNISISKRGENGFGFDEIFEIDDGRTLAQLSDEEKNNLSSRKKALEILKEKLKRS